MINLYNQNCIEVMRNIPSNYYDLGIVDPPYGIGDFRNSYSTERHKKIEWNNEIPSEEYFHHLFFCSYA